MLQNKKLFIIGLIAHCIGAAASGLAIIFARELDAGIMRLCAGAFCPITCTMMFLALKKTALIKKIYIFVLFLCVCLLIMGLLTCLGVVKMPNRA